MQQYTLAFIFFEDKILLIRKNKPEWQAGKLNGIGGKVKEGEDVIDCLIREVKEEANLDTIITNWNHFATLKGDDFRVYCYYTYYDTKPDFKQMTKEKLEVWYANALPSDVIYNLFYLVPLALETPLKKPSSN